MNVFLKSVLHRINRNTKNIKIFSKYLKRKQRKNTTPTNYLNVLKIIKKHGVLWNNIIGKPKIKSTNRPHKFTIKFDVYNKRKMINTFNNFFTNIGQKLAIQITKSSKTFET